MKRPFARFFPTVVLALSFVFGASAAPLTHDLGQGLSYQRAHALPADLPATSAAHLQPLVLDLRFATGDPSAATALAAWLKFRSAPRAPLFVLANSATSPALLAALADREHAAGLIVLGPAAAGFTPDIALPISPDLDRGAYDAFEAGASLDALINPPINKPRNDEAKLALARRPDPGPPDPTDHPGAAVLPATDPATPPAGTLAPAKPTTAPVVVDVVLQRALHLHRALLALKRI